MSSAGIQYAVPKPLVLEVVDSEDPANLGTSSHIRHSNAQGGRLKLGMSQSLHSRRRTSVEARRDPLQLSGSQRHSQFEAQFDREEKMQLARSQSTSAGASRRISVAAGEGQWLKKHHEAMRRKSDKKEDGESRLSLSLSRSTRDLLDALNISGHRSKTFFGAHDMTGHKRKSIRAHEDETTPPVSSEESPENCVGSSKKDEKPMPEAELTSGNEWACSPEVDGAAIEGEEIINETQAQGDIDHNHGERKQIVSFSNVTVRYYDLQLGDNPACTSGPPLSIGWDYDESMVDADIPIDIFEEAQTGVRKSDWDLVLSRSEREERLLDSGYNRTEIAHSVRQALRIKDNRRQTVLNMQYSGLEEMTEGFTKATKKIFHVRRSSRHLFEDWKNNKTSNRSISKLDKVPFSGQNESAEPMQEKDTGRTMTEASMPIAAMASHVGEGSSQVQLQTQGQWEAVTTRRKSTMGSNNNENRREVLLSGECFGITQSWVSSRAILNEEDDDDDLEPFAVVDLLSNGSPAEAAGIQKGDQVLKFGSATAKNGGLEAVPELTTVAAIKEKPIPVKVLREGALHDLAFQPRLWNGRGLMGFLMKSAKTVDTD